MKMEHTAQKNNEEWCNTVNTESSYGQEEWFAPNMTKLVEEWCTLYNLHEEQCTIKRRGLHEKSGVWSKRVGYNQHEKWCTIKKRGVPST